MKTFRNGRLAATGLGLALALAGCAAGATTSATQGAGQGGQAAAPAVVAKAAPAAKVAAATTRQIVNVRKGPNVKPANGIGRCAQSPGCPKVLFDVTGFAPGSVWTVSASNAQTTVSSSAKLTVNSAGTGYTWSGYIVFANGTGPVSVTLSSTAGTVTSAKVAW